MLNVMLLDVVSLFFRHILVFIVTTNPIIEQSTRHGTPTVSNQYDEIPTRSLSTGRLNTRGVEIAILDQYLAI